MTQKIEADEFDAVSAPTDGSTAVANHVEAAGREPDRLRTSLLIGLCCLVIYNANLRSISAGDTYPARYLPFAVVQYHTIYFNPIATVAAQGRVDTAYWLLTRPDGRIVSLYPVIVPLLVAPLYVPAVGYLHLRGWSETRLDFVARVMEKLAASFVAALSVALLYLLLRRRAKPKSAMLLTLAYAFGTTTWVVSSQALWQHGMAQLLLVGALLLLTASANVPRTLAAGLLLGLVACNRPPDLVLAAALGVYGLVWAGRRRAPLLAAAAALPTFATLLYNLDSASNVMGGYGASGNASFFQHDFLTGVAGLLVSPTRGLLVFSPFLLFLVLAWRHLPADRRERGLTVAMAVAVVLQLVLYAKADWRSGLSWGPRYMTDLLPFFVWMLAPVVDALRRVGRALFILAVGVAIAIEAIGAFCYLDSHDLPIFAADRGAEEDDMRDAFRWRNAPFITSWNAGLAPMELLVEMRGGFDAVESGGRATSEIVAGEEAAATGWALAGDASPFQVAVMIDDRRAAATNTYFDRSDVRAALGEASPAGWRVALDTTGLAPGEHRLTALAWAFPRGEPRFLAVRTLMVRGAPGAGGAAPVGAAQQDAAARGVPADLSEAFGKAVALLREHQQPQGYWLTTFTSKTRFHEPHPEMNTYLTAMLVDLLNPVAAGAGLEESLQRARTHLTAQIESNGLVRYHGLPDGPGIGTLGCAITPDTDDTALVWRLAPAEDRDRLTAALATIEGYRTPEGLYRSWLAPREAYQCLDPGRDPNPADIAIQMHLLQLLAEVRPAAGRALCEALRPVAGDDRVWVYYEKTPLVPMLRRTDLRRAGCALELPESRMRTDIPEQQIWVTVVRLLSDATTSGGAPPDPVLVRAVLRELARDDFALVKANPPLLYHNDLTATVPRYYWSEDVGYALWLRLYDEYGQARDPRAGE